MIYFIGCEPSPRMKPDAKPFQGAACEKRLNEWIKFLLNMSDLEFSLITNEYVLINSDSVAFTMMRAYWLVDSGFFITRQYKIIALGNNASKKLGRIPHFKLPHTSGRNRQLNNKEYINNILQECRTWILE